MHRGYIKLWRKVSDNPIWTDSKFTPGQAWIDLILLANHKPGHIRIRGIKVDIPRGYCGWSQVALAERWKWSRGKVIRFLDELETIQQIEQQKNNVTSLIKIINYDQYQSNDTADRTANSTTDGQQTDSKRYTNNNENNEKNEKKVPIASPSKNGKKPIPANFEISDEMKSWFNSQDFMCIEIKSATDQFADYWKSKGKMMKDWTATWRNGMRKAEQWAREKSPNSLSYNPPPANLDPNTRYQDD